MANDMMAGSEKAIVPDRDLKPGMDVLDEMLSALGPEGGMVEETEMVEGEMPADAMPGGDAMGDVEVIASALGIEAAQAQALFDAAQQMAKTRGKSGKELADMLADDFQLRMELEKLAGGAADQMEMDMAEDMGGMMPPEMPPEMPAP
jgi:hypothetical protein